MKIKLGLLFILLLVLMNAALFAQRPISVPGTDTGRTFTAQDSLQQDSLKLTNDSIPSSISISPRAFEVSDQGFSAKVKYDAQDSTSMDPFENKAYLYGAAVVTYETIELKADYIEIDLDSNIVFAAGRQDSLGNWSGLPHFKEKDQEFDAFEMRYNFKTQKGHISKVGTTQSGMNVRGAQAKLIRVEGDSSTQDIVYSENTTISTCDHDEPHYGIRSKKQKVIANKFVVIGPSNLEIMNIPTPLWLPFGFFPVQKGKSTGLIFPRDYETNNQFGFGLNNVGWYFPVNDNINLQLTTDIYTRGTYRLRSVMDYRKKYKYSGSVRLEYASIKRENSQGFYEREPWSIRLNINHSQDSKAHPSRRVGGRVNIETNNASRNNYNDAYSQLNNTLNSNFSYSESFPGRPYNLSVAFAHSQNTSTRKMEINFPTIDFKTQTLFPFERKKAVGAQRWYEKISFRYNMQAKANVVTTDSTLFDPETLDLIKYGAEHKASSNASFKFFKYFNFNPNVNYKELWYFKTLEKTFDPETVITYDETVDPVTGELVSIPVDTLYGTVNEEFVPGMKAARSFNTGFSVDTKLFGTFLLTKGPVRGIRHTVTPRVGFNYKPDYSNSFWGYSREVMVDSRRLDSLMNYSIFEDGIYRAESIDQAGQAAMTYGIQNNIQIKLYSRKDTTVNNVDLIRGFNISGNYNFLADSLNWSTISMSGNTNILKGLSSWQFSSTWDPYEQTETGQRYNSFVWNEKRKPFQLTRANLSITNKLSLSKIRSLLNIEEEKEENALPEAASFSSLLEKFNFTHTYQLRWTRRGESVSREVANHRVNVVGSFDLTPMWKIRVNTFGYDFINKTTIYPAFNISRKLHCWEMGASWFPQNESIQFYIRVPQGSVFDFLNVPYRKGNLGAGGGFGRGF